MLLPSRSPLFPYTTLFRSNNRATAAATGDILLFLNNDVAVTKNWLDPLSDTFRNGVADIVQPKLRSWRDPDYFEYAGACGGYIDRLGFPFCRGRLFATAENAVR